MSKLGTVELPLPLAQASGSIHECLRNVFGFQAFRGSQQEVIESAMAGRDSLVVMPTGGGKSLCYQVPALQQEGVGLVVSPLIALMQDQVSALHELGVDAGFLNSNQSADEQRQVISRLQNGSLKLLYVAPERLAADSTRQLLAGLRVSLIAIDEAHCVSQWGHDFRQEYLALDELGTLFPGVPRMALTATATERTRVEIVDRLGLNNPDIYVAPFDRANIRYLVQPKIEPKAQLLRFLDGHRGAAGIVYCLSRKKTESTAAWLSEQGFAAIPYHAGLDAGTRNLHQRRFLTEEGLIIVATIAFGMGIDKPDVRFVAHLDLPKSMEAYYQETGRAGRDGEPADAWMVYGLQDVVRLRQMLDESIAGEEHKRHERAKLDGLLGWCEVTGCRRRPLLEYFGDTLDEDCGNCDGCLAPVATWDGTEAAQMLLSAVYRTGQRFGTAHVIDVLLGNRTAKVEQHHHAEISVFGIGSERSSQNWRSVVRQLIVQGYLRSDADRYGALVLTDRSRGLLRGETPVRLRLDPKRPLAAKTKVTRVASPINDQDRDLWDALRACRQHLASEHSVPPYVIFHDSTLRQMLEKRPQDETELLALNGVGQTKLERYGKQFLAILRHSRRD